MDYNFFSTSLLVKLEMLDLNSIKLLTNELNNKNETSNVYQNLSLEICPKVDNYTKRHIGQALLLIEDLEEFEVLKYNSDIEPGGNWKPKNCFSRYKVYIFFIFALFFVKKI